jgi:hypothetical protein
MPATASLTRWPASLGAYWFPLPVTKAVTKAFRCAYLQARNPSLGGSHAETEKAVTNLLA